MKQEQQEAGVLVRSPLSIYIIIVGLVSIAVGAEYDDDNCLRQYKNLAENPSINGTFVNLMNAFNETCSHSGGGFGKNIDDRCLSYVDPVKLYLSQDYGRIPGITRVTLKNFCERRLGRQSRTLCDVNITTVFTTSVDDDNSGVSVKLTTHLMEIDKPVCFPNTCEATEAHAQLVEPPLASCQQSDDCEVVSYQVHCPNRRPSATSDRQCLSDMLSSVSPFWLQRKTVEASMFLDCATAMSPTKEETDKSTCSVEIGDMSGGMLMNFTGFEDEENGKEAFAAYEEACFAYGGRICRVGMNGQLRIDPDATSTTSNEMGALPSNTELGNMHVANILIDYPLCVPPTNIISGCATEGDVTEVLEQSFVDFMAEKGASCDIHSPNCNITVTSVSCYDDLSSTPTLTTTSSVDNSLLPTHSVSDALMQPPSMYFTSVSHFQDEENSHSTDIHQSTDIIP